MGRRIKFFDLNERSYPITFPKIPNMTFCVNKKF